MHIGARIKTERARLGMSQTKLALAAGVSCPYLANVELGKSQPTVAWLEKVAAALHVPVSVLLDASPPAGRIDSGTAKTVQGPELSFYGGFHSLAKAYGAEPEIEMLDFAEREPPPNVALLLGLPPAEPALYRVRRQGINKVRYRIISSWMPLDLFGAVVERRPQERALFDVLAEDQGVRVVRADEKLAVRCASAGEALRLGIAEGDCVFDIERICWTDTHRVAEVANVIAPARLWELWYRYPVGSANYAEDWSWIRHSPPSSRSQAGTRRGRRPV